MASNNANARGAWLARLGFLLAAIATLPYGIPDVRAIDFTPAGTQPGPHGVLPSSDCRSCHGPAEAPQAPTIAWSTWAGSMMAHATRDPVFWAALDVANSDVPGVGDYCLRCHAPAAWLEGRVSKDGQGGLVAGGPDGCALLGDHDDDDEFGRDYGGVGCHLCHRLEETGPAGQVARRENANLWIDLDGCGGQPCRYGPYQYSEPDITTPPHAAAPSEFVKRSEFCGTCHDVTTPIADTGPLRTLRDSTGADTGIPFPVERTFSEWRASAYADRIFGDGFAEYEPRTQAERYGQTCQACHMRNSSDPAAVACNYGSSRTGNLPTHEFAGANAWVLRLVRDLYGPALGTDRVAAIDRGILLAQQMLAASATVQATVLSNSGGTLQARVRVTNLSGHKLPTGYAEGRRMWLEVQAFAGGNPVPFWRSGNYVAATGELQDGDFPPRVYEVKQGIWNAGNGTCETEDAQGREQFHFVLNNCVAKDNRIPPLGFRGGTSLELRPVGATYPETSPGSGVLVNHDDVNYAIPVAGQVGQIEVRATLRHQVASRDYIEFLRDEAERVDVPTEEEMCAAQRPVPFTTGPQDQRRADFLYDLWTTSGRSPPETIATSSTFSG